jgi:uncharacterized protein (TIGR03437 family)
VERPVIREAGIVNAASGLPPLSRGALVSIYGTGLAPGEQIAAQYPLPIQMSGVSVSVNDRRVPLLFVSPELINFQMPFETEDAPVVAVSYAGVNSLPVATGPNLRADASPGIFLLSRDGQAAVLIGGTTLIPRVADDGVSRPARRGEIISIYCTGLGAVSNQPPSGSAAPLSPLSETLGTATVIIGEIRSTVLFSGLAPGLVGVNQVNAQIPENAPAGGRVPIVIRVNEGISSNPAFIAIE